MSTEMVEVPAIHGSFARSPAQDVSASEWVRKLVREGMPQSGSQQVAIAALNSMEVGHAESWQAASRRLNVVYRAHIADARRPHISEAAFVWRYITEDQVKDLMERLVDLLLSNPFDQPGLQGVVHERVLCMQVGILPLQIYYLHPLSPNMTFRGRMTKGFYSGIIDLVSTRKSG